MMKLLRLSAAMAYRNKLEPYLPSELELVFDSIWKQIRTPELGDLEQVQLRLALARYLVILSNRGVRDAVNLRERALEHFLPERWSA